MGKGSGKQKVKVVKGIGLAVANFDNLSNKRLVAKNIKNSNKIKSTKNIVAYNPRTSSYVYGTLAEVSKQIKEEFEDKYKEHLGSKDYLKEKEEIIKFGEETKKEIKDFKSNLDSLK